MWEIKMMNGDKFLISEDTLLKLKDKGGLIFLKELDGIINMSSITSILPQYLSENTGDRRKLHDGTYAIRKFGTWFDEKNPEIKIDQSYYPELAKDYFGQEFNRLK